MIRSIVRPVPLWRRLLATNPVHLYRPGRIVAPPPEWQAYASFPQFLKKAARNELVVRGLC